MKSFYVIKLNCQCWKINLFGGEGGIWAPPSV